MPEEQNEDTLGTDVVHLAHKKAVENAVNKLIFLKQITARTKMLYEAALDEEKEFVSALDKISDTNDIMSLLAKPPRKPL